jgi:hypothetical protein
MTVITDCFQAITNIPLHTYRLVIVDTINPSTLPRMAHNMFKAMS